MIPPTIYAIIAALLIGGFSGWKLTSGHYDAASLAAEHQHQAEYRAAVERGNEASARLLTAESQIRTIATWKGKQIAQVTTDRPCLSADALGLLNATTVPRIAAHPGQSLAAGSATPPAADRHDASDADVIQWAIDAVELYETCASRLTELQGVYADEERRSNP